MIKKLKMQCHGQMLVMILTEKKLLKRFTKKNCRKQIKKSLELKSYKEKGDKLYVKWKNYDSSFNSRIDKKDSINKWIFSRTEIFRSKSES